MRDAMFHVGNSEELVRLVRARLGDFEREAHDILGRHETATRSRTFTADQTRRQLQGLSVRQQDLLEEAIQCAEQSLYRAAHVSAWQAFVDLLLDKLASDGLVKVHAAKPGWTKHNTLDDLRDNVTEYQLIEAGRDVALLSKAEMKSLHGMLSTRNQCAHPTAYQPGFNETLGFISGLLNFMGTLQTKSL